LTSPTSGGGLVSPGGLFSPGESPSSHLQKAHDFELDLEIKNLPKQSVAQKLKFEEEKVEPKKCLSIFDYKKRKEQLK
jgi:hypothetical protein